MIDADNALGLVVSQHAIDAPETENLRLVDDLRARLREGELEAEA